MKASAGFSKQADLADDLQASGKGFDRTSPGGDS